MLVNRESRGSTATLQLFQTSIVVMMGRLMSDGGAQVVMMMRWDEVQSWHVHLNKSSVTYSNFSLKILRVIEKNTSVS